MSITRSLLLAAALAASTALAGTAQAEIFTHGSNCGPDPGYEPFTGKDDLTIFSVDQFTYINCFARDFTQNINVSQVRTSVFTSDGGPVICVVSGFRSEGGGTIRTFGPLTLKSDFTGSSELAADVPQSNNTQYVYFNCHLSAPTDIGPSRLINYVVHTR